MTTRTPPILVAVADLPDIWMQIKPRVKAAVARSHGRDDVVDLYCRVNNGDAWLWIWRDAAGVIKAFCLTEIIHFPGKTVGAIRLLTGVDREDWLHCGEAIEQWARSKGARGMLLVTRPGWTRYLSSIGYQHTHNMLEKDFD